MLHDQGGGVARVATSAGIPSARLEQIARGAGAEPDEASAIARAVGVPLTMLFTPAPKNRAWLVPAILGGMLLIVFLIALLAAGILARNPGLLHLETHPAAAQQKTSILPENPTKLAPPVIPKP
jgi:hypothetical protein